MITSIGGPTRVIVRNSKIPAREKFVRTRYETAAAPTATTSVASIMLRIENRGCQGRAGRDEGFALMPAL
jgi:hypothetical protein